MSRLRESWERFWFEPVTASNLGICRALFYGLVLLLYGFDGFTAWGDVSKAFWFPIQLFEWLSLPVPGPSALFVVDAAWKLSLLAAALGLGTRSAAVVAFVLGIYRLGVPQNFGKIHHFDAMIVLTLGVLAFARSGDAWSLDRRFGWTQRGGATAVSGEYRWPVRAVWLIMSLVFFAAGFSKLRHGGVGWIASRSMSLILAQHAYEVANANPITHIGLWLSRYPHLCALLALVTLVTEAGYPLAMFSRRARWIFPPGMICALIGIRVMMGPTFPQFVICHLFWVPWDVVADKLRAWRAKGG